MKRPVQLSVIGAGDANRELYELAYRVGGEVARSGSVLVCGGLGGVMAGACQGAREAGGRTVGILPGSDASAANPWVEVVVPTGLGHARNVLVVQSGDAVLALPGSWGTLSELALALKSGRPVVSVGGWQEFDGVAVAGSPEEAVALTLLRIGKRS